MNKLTFRLAVLGLIIIGLVHLPSLALVKAAPDPSYNPTLSGAQVSPENGQWGSTFTFSVVYTDENGSLPTSGYPRLYLDNTELVMEESDSEDNDTIDGKVYQKSWVSAKENVESHSFYFYVETATGENARYPENDTYDGPQVTKRYVSLSWNVDNPNPTAGETVTFSGYLKISDENLGVVGENLVLCKLLADNDVSVSSATTDENGYFTLSLDVPEEGVLCYRIRFLGDNYYEASSSFSLYVNTLDKPLVLGILAAVLLALVGALMFLFSRGVIREHYLMPVLLGFGLGFFLVLMGATDIGILAGGAIAGYLFARRTDRWTKHLRVGCMVGFLFTLVVVLIFAYYFTASPALFGPSYSLPQMEVLKFLLMLIIYNLVYYSLLVGIGAVLGGMLRKLLKPAAQKP